MLSELLDTYLHVLWSTCDRGSLRMLTVCSKRIGQQLPVIRHNEIADASDKRQGNSNNMRVLLADHSTLCDTMEGIGAKVSSLLLLYTCNGLVWIISFIRPNKTGRLLNDYIYCAYAGTFLFCAGLRVGALVYLSDQVRWKHEHGFMFNQETFLGVYGIDFIPTSH